MKGRVYVVCVDSLGQAMWVSQVFSCTTRGSRGDLFTSSDGRETFLENFPAEVGKYTVRLDILQGDSPSRNWRAARDTLIDAIKAAGQIAKEVQNVMGQLQK